MNPCRRLARALSTQGKIPMYVNGKKIFVDPWYTVWQACQGSAVPVPRFCYQENLPVSGNCRMCLVEVEGINKPIPSCSTIVSPNMKVNTNSEKSKIAQGGLVEFLLANHPLDCPICDQSGECDLQNISIQYGYNKPGRFSEFKRAVESKDIGPLVKTSMNRCIHCTRCVRFTNAVVGQSTLGATGRGGHKEIGTYVDKYLTNEMSGNIADLCPVGALTHNNTSFKYRTFELNHHYSVDVMDGLGSSIEVDSKWTDVARILPRINEDVNEEWISDKSRYAFDGLKYQRLPYPMIKINNVLQECSWMDVMKFISQHVKGIPGYEIAGSIGPFQDVESLIAYRDFMHRLGSDDLEYIHKELAIDNTFRIQYLMNSRIRGVEDADVLLIIGTNLRNECPVLNSRIRKAVQKGLKVGIIGSAVNTFYEYTHLGNHPSSITQLLNSSNKFSQLLQNAKLPMVIMGSSVMERDDGKMIYNNVMKLVQECGIIKPKSKWNGFNVFQKYTSSAAALDIGITYKPRKTAPKVAYLLGSDDYESKDISSDTFVIYQGHTGDRGAARADVILPGCSYLEKNATYVNTEGRPQYGRKVGI